MFPILLLDARENQNPNLKAEIVPSYLARQNLLAIFSKGARKKASPTLQMMING